MKEDMDKMINDKRERRRVLNEVLQLLASHSDSCISKIMAKFSNMTQIAEELIDDMMREKIPEEKQKEFLNILTQFEKIIIDFSEDNNKG